MVAGGGASVIYADTIVDMGGVKELANYGKIQFLKPIIYKYCNSSGIYLYV